MIVEDLIKILKSQIRLCPEYYALGGTCSYTEPLYEGYPEDVPYKFIGLEVIEIKPANYVLEVRVNTKIDKGE